MLNGIHKWCLGWAEHCTNDPHLLHEHDCDDLDAALNLYDSDEDGYSTCTEDCDDTDAAIHPGAEEICDQLDQDCDDIIDEVTTCFDDDGDGVTELSGDCDDTNPNTYPGAEEICDDEVDNDCDVLTDKDDEECGACADCESSFSGGMSPKGSLVALLLIAVAGLRRRRS